MFLLLCFSFSLLFVLKHDASEIDCLLQIGERITKSYLSVLSSIMNGPYQKF